MNLQRSGAMGRQNNFDALRLIGALLVIVGHSYALTGRVVPVLAGLEIHSVGVKLFFVISGFLITASYQRDSNLRRFAARRALRIMPALIAVVLLTVIALAFLTNATAANYARGALLYAVRNILLLPYHALPGIFDNNRLPAVNGSLWTLPVEAFMYAVTPFLVKAPRIALPILAVLMLIHPVAGSVFGFGLAGAASVIPYFLGGAFIQLMRLPLPGWAALASVTLLLLAFLIDVPEILIAAPFTVLAVYVGTSGSPFRLPMDISYGTYLLAFPVQQSLISYYPPIPSVVLMLLTIAIVTPIAVLSWLFIEAPAIRAARRLRAPTVLRSDHVSG